MTDDIETLLDNFTRELDYFVYTRDHLEPGMSDLLRKIETYFSSRDAESLVSARESRAAYVEKMQGLGSLLDDWVGIRGSGERLWEAEHAMSQAQFDRFQALLDREGQVSRGRDHFDQLQEILRTKLLLLEEMSG